MKRTTALAMAQAYADLLERRLAALPDVAEGREAYQAALDRLAEIVRATLPARASLRHTAAEGWTLSAYGIRRSCTSGLEPACRRWIAAAREAHAEAADA